MIVNVEARALWNDTQMDVAAGDLIEISAEGRWTDSTIDTDADGFRRWYLWALGWMKRVPAARWFELIAVVGKRARPCHRIGRHGSFVAPASGRLYLFANDASFKYGNNHGQVTATVIKRNA